MSNNNSSASNKNELAHNSSNNKPNVNETTEFQYFMKEFLGFFILIHIFLIKQEL